MNTLTLQSASLLPRQAGAKLLVADEQSARLIEVESAELIQREGTERVLINGTIEVPHWMQLIVAGPWA